MKEIKTKLKNTQPYFIEHELLDKLYFKEDEKDTEYWVFKYYFLRHLSELSISVRLGYMSRDTINYKLKNILKRNKALIEDFLNKMHTKI